MRGGEEREATEAAAGWQADNCQYKGHEVSRYYLASCLVGIQSLSWGVYPSGLNHVTVQ
jgi:hypothetical protein